MPSVAVAAVPAPAVAVMAVAAMAVAVFFAPACCFSTATDGRPVRALRPRGGADGSCDLKFCKTCSFASIAPIGEANSSCAILHVRFSDSAKQVRQLKTSSFLCCFVAEAASFQVVARLLRMHPDEHSATARRSRLTGQPLGRAHKYSKKDARNALKLSHTQSVRDLLSGYIRVKKNRRLNKLLPGLFGT